MKTGADFAQMQKGKWIMSDLIDRQEAIDALAKQMPKSYTLDGSHPADEEIFKAQEVYADCIKTIELLLAAQPDGIPLEWIDKHLEWLDNCDNDFAQLAKVSIKAMVELWKKDRI